MSNISIEALSLLLDEKFEGQNKLIDEKFKNNDDCHSRLEKQATYTNGRVRKLEKWMYACGGAIAVLGFSIGNISKIKDTVVAILK